MDNIKNKIIFITGASSGIGEETARLLASQGAVIVLAARRIERLKTLAEEITKNGGTARVHSVDVTDLQAFQSAVDKTIAEFGKIDVLFNNAGIMPLSPLKSLKVNEWNSMIDINIKGVLNGIAAVLPTMEKQQYGHIINTASVAAHNVWPSCAVYCATKYAVRALSEGLRMESQTIRVTVISPGAVATELGNDITDADGKALLDNFRGMAQILSPDSIARAVLYAISQPDDVDVNEIIVRPVQQLP